MPICALFKLKPIFKLNYGPEIAPPPPNKKISSALLVVSDIGKHIFLYVQYQRQVPGPPRGGGAGKGPIGQTDKQTITNIKLSDACDQ